MPIQNMKYKILNKKTISLFMSGLIVFSNAMPVMAIENSNSEISTYINEISSGSITLTVTDIKGNTLGGLEFNVKNSNGKTLQFVTNNGNYEVSENGYYQSIKTDNNGRVTITGLQSDTYNLAYNNTNKDYISTNETKINVGTNNTNASIQLKQNTGDMVFTITGEDGTTIPNAKFVIKNSNDQNLNFATSNGIYEYSSNGTEGLVSNTGGKITVNDLPVGEYTIVQTETPVEYNGSLISQKFTISLDNQTTVSAINTKEYGNVSINVIDSNSSNSLNGSEFNLLDANGNRMLVVKSDGFYSFSRTSGANNIETKSGKVDVQGLPTGKYTLVETKTPTGYNKSENLSFDITKNGNSVVSVKNIKAVGILAINVKDEKTTDPVENYSFELKNGENKINVTKNSDGNYSYNTKSEETIITSNKDGSIILSDLPVGTYTIIQYKPANGYMLDTAESQQTINSQQTTTFDINVSKTNSSMTIVDENNKAIKDIKVQIIDKDKNVVCENQTNEEGKMLLSGVSEGDYTYVIKDVPSPYLNKEYKENFKVNKDGETENLEVCTIEFNKIIIDTKTKKSGAEFQLIKIEKSNITDTKKSNTNNNSNKETSTVKAKTNNKGIATFSELEDGEYLVKQISASEGYKVSTEEQRITIDRKTDKEQKVIFKNVSINGDSTELDTSLEKDEKNNSGIIIIVLLAIVVIGAIAYTLVRLKKEQKEALTEENNNDDSETVNEDISSEEIDNEQIPDIQKPELEEFIEDPYSQEAQIQANDELSENISNIIKENREESNNTPDTKKGQNLNTKQGNLKKE